MKILFALVAAAGAALPALDGSAEEAKESVECCEEARASCCDAEAAVVVAPRSDVKRRVEGETGTIVGRATWAGDDAPEKKADLKIGGKEAEGCDHGGTPVDTTDRSLLVSDDGGVANVVLTLQAEGVEVETPEEPIVLDQLHCRFEPHVVVVPAGATLRYDNSDPINHNVHTYSRKNSQINNNVAASTHFDQTLDKAEVFEVKCDIHTWMKSYVFVTDATNWDVSAADGTFRLEDVPPGTYKLEWWHEELGKGSEEVTVEAGEETEVELGVGEKKKRRRGGR